VTSGSSVVDVIMQSPYTPVIAGLDPAIHLLRKASCEE